MENQTQIPQDVQPMPKKYQPPKLVEYGSLAELTKTSGQGNTDATFATIAG